MFTACVAFSTELGAGVVMSLVEEVVTSLKNNGQTVSLAESCTGGLVASMFTKLSGVSSVFRGGVVSYHGEVKRDVLKVDENLLKEHGEVSIPVAEAMASGVRQCMASDWAAGITGIAGPTGGSADKPVGTVCFAVVGPNFERSLQHNFKSDLSREQIQQASAEFALNLLNEALKNK